MTSQSTLTPVPLVLKSLTPGRIVLAIATASVCTTFPSMEKTTLEAVQSMRKRCGVPSQLPGGGFGIWNSETAPLLLVRAKSELVVSFVLKIVQDSPDDKF